MKIEEIYKRIMVCEKKERDFLEVGNTRTANRYHNEIQKWEEILNQLNPKMEKELNEYRRGYYKQKEVIDDCKEDISNLLDIINKNCDELKCTSDEWLVIQKYQDEEVSE